MMPLYLETISVNMGGKTFPSQIILNKDSQELGWINLFSIFVINFYSEIWHWFVIVFIFKDHNISFINISWKFIQFKPVRYFL